jgi:adenylate cyclase
MQTFLFADLVGFTALSIERGDEQAADVATRFQHEVKRLAARHEATVVKSLGDGAMVCARDAGAALRLGLELANGLDDLPPVRVGVNTGPAVERDGDFFGSTVNLAARLSQAARGGEVLVTEATRAAARSGRPRFEERGPRTFRNARDPVVVYAALKRRFVCPYMAARPRAA